MYEGGDSCLRGNHLLLLNMADVDIMCGRGGCDVSSIESTVISYSVRRSCVVKCYNHWCLCRM